MTSPSAAWSSRVPAGPQIWEITNVGEQPRQVVFWRTNGPVTVEQFQQMMAGLMSGTPVPGAPTFDQFTGVAYAAILSPGKTVWLEPDLTPGTYMVVSYVFDPRDRSAGVCTGHGSALHRRGRRRHTWSRRRNPNRMTTHHDQEHLTVLAFTVMSDGLRDAFDLWHPSR